MDHPSEEQKSKMSISMYILIPDDEHVGERARRQRTEEGMDAASGSDGARSKKTKEGTA